MTDNKELRKLIIPLILEQMLAVSAGMVDTIMVSTVGEVAVSGVALADNINRLIIQVMAAFAAGGIVISSQYYGSGNISRTKHTCAQLETLMAIFSIVTALCCIVFSRGILGAIFGSIEKDVMTAANTYLIVTAISYPFLGMYNAGAAILRSLGNSKISMNISVVMNIINVGLNALFVFVFKWGVLGVGLATLAGRIAAAAMMKKITVSAKNPLKITDIKDYIPEFFYIKRILKIGIPSGVENGMFQIGKLLVVSMIAALGTDAIAANAIAYQVIDFPNIPGSAVGLALVVVVGQSIGAGKNDAAVADSKKLLRIAYLGDWICKIILFVTAPFIVSVFSLSDGAHSIAVTVIKCFAIASLPVWPLSFTLPNALRGAGDVNFTMSVSIASMWLCRIVISYILINRFDLGVLGVWLGMFADWYVRGIFYTWRFASKRWLKKKVI
ncbi:MAG: MATE family efflux transporter [Oscillospiraceae bacterium]|nr:MATE family efflux transporter [Oscillospiraceae bacterium]